MRRTRRGGERGASFVFLTKQTQRFTESLAYVPGEFERLFLNAASRFLKFFLLSAQRAIEVPGVRSSSALQFSRLAIDTA